VTPLVQTRALTKIYHQGRQDFAAVENVELTLAAGELVGLLGPSGSGKTTLLNLLCGWEHPNGGEIAWQGKVLADAATLGWSEVAVLPQSIGLVEELSVRQNVELPLRYSNGLQAGAERSRALLDELGLARFQDRMPHEISLGEQQRTALARTLITEPLLVLADEPTGHQDSGWGHEVFRVLRQACERGAAVLVATHNLEVLQHFDRTISIKDGHLT
jgi:ABC-type lipoprotein export system ATPase subunit